MTEKMFTNILKLFCKMPEKLGKHLSLVIWSKLTGLKKWKEREKNNYSG